MAAQTEVTCLGEGLRGTRGDAPGPFPQIACGPPLPRSPGPGRRALPRTQNAARTQIPEPIYPQKLLYNNNFLKIKTNLKDKLVKVKKFDSKFFENKPSNYSFYYKSAKPAKSADFGRFWFVCFPERHPEFPNLYFGQFCLAKTFFRQIHPLKGKL